MDDRQQSPFDMAFQQLLNALAAACLSVGKGYAEYDMASRSAFVTAVKGRETGSELSAAAVSFLTGVNETHPAHNGAEGGAPSPAWQFIELWRAEASDSDGRSNPLPRTGPLSVLSLLERVSSSPPLDDALAALEAVGLIEVRDGLVYLDDQVLPGAASIETATAMCAGAYPLLAAITAGRHRLPPLLESSTLVSVRQNDVPRLHRIAESKLREAQEKVAELLTAYDALSDAESSADEETATVSSGIYFVASGRP